ncbi:MAG: hypothetical protein ACLUPG_19160 [Roseburia faecis]
MGPLEYINTVRILPASSTSKDRGTGVRTSPTNADLRLTSTFNRNFKQMMGVTPVEWRKRPENYEQRLLNYEIHIEKGW